jgi:hypothetical protein
MNVKDRVILTKRNMKRRKRNKLEVPFQFPYTDRMKNKVTATGSEYQSTISEIHKSLQKLQSIMNRPEFETYSQSEEAEDEGNVYGCFSSFISETAEMYARE